MFLAVIHQVMIKWWRRVYKPDNVFVALPDLHYSFSEQHMPMNSNYNALLKHPSEYIT